MTGSIQRFRYVAFQLLPAAPDPMPAVGPINPNAPAATSMPATPMPATAVPPAPMPAAMMSAVPAAVMAAPVPAAVMSAMMPTVMPAMVATAMVTAMSRCFSRDGHRRSEERGGTKDRELTHAKILPKPGVMIRQSAMMATLKKAHFSHTGNQTED